MTEELRGARAAAEEARRREAAALSELARYDAMNKRRMEQVQALLATAGAGATRTSGACIKDCGDTERNVKFVVAGEAEARVTQHLPRHKVATPDDTSTELAALGEAIAEHAREVADLKVCPASCFLLLKKFRNIPSTLSAASISWCINFTSLISMPSILKNPRPGWQQAPFNLYDA